MNNKEKLLNLKCKATGIGSVPHTDINFVSDLIIKKCPEIPYWPQCVNVNAREGMMAQYTENLPCIKLDDNNNILYDKSENRNEKLLEFFENLTSNNYEYFRISREFAGGFYTLLEKLKHSDIIFIKGQIVGPVTFMYSLIGEDGKSILFDDELSDAIVRGLAMKAVWQAKEIIKIGKIPVIFFDEPSMSGFGSAFMPLNREQAMNIFNKLVDTIKEHEDMIIGMHCCGNSDWDMLLETKIDIISFDAYSYLENFLIYTEAIIKFLKRDGIIAWGIVPTSDYNDSINPDILMRKFNDAFNILIKTGIDKEFLLKRSLFTPACGMGKLSKEVAEKVIDLTSKLADNINSY